MITNILALTPEAIAATEELDVFDKLRGFKQRIADLRRMNCHVTAAIMRDTLLCEIEQYLDPAGLEHRTTLQEIQGKAAVELALAIDPRCGF